MPYFKSDFDPLLLLGQNYVCHLTTVRRDLVDRLGGLRSEFDGAQDWDLVLRVDEVVDARRHGPHPPRPVPLAQPWGSTSKTSDAKPWALDAGRRAVAAALARRGVAAEVVRSRGPGSPGAIRAARDPAPLASILIPTRDGRLPRALCRVVLERTDYPNFEVVVIDNGSGSRDRRRPRPSR